jgi:hypothetical protein
MANDLSPSDRISTALTCLQQRDIATAERLLLQALQPECTVYHHFAPGLYIREVHLPAGIVAIGHEQRFAHWNIFLKGKVLILKDDGTEALLEAPMQFIGQPGRKVGYILEDVVWQNVYATNETDVETLERHFINKSPQWQREEDAQITSDYASHIADRRDYRSILRDLGLTEAEVQKTVQNPADQCIFPADVSGVKLGNSPIHGKGLFATRPFAAGEVIAPARIAGFRTPAGRYTNHSLTPNATMTQQSNGDITLTALTAIAGCHGGFNGDEITIDYRQALRLSGNSEDVKCLQLQ